jgi:polyhydroxybutyrate depolymerase
MKYIRRAAAVIVIVLAIAFVGFAVIRAQKVKADAAFIVAAKLQTVTLTVKGVERRALVHLPESYDRKTPQPLVLMFHGNGGTAESVAKETGWVAKADAAGFIVVFPEGTRPDMTQPPKFGRNNPAWNDGSGRFHAGERNVADVAFIAALLDHLEAEFAVDKRRVFATGFSNGASMAFRVGLELAERIAAIAPVSGALWIAKPKAAQPVSLLYITGTADPINPMEGGAPKMASGSGFKGVPEKAKPPVREMVWAWVKLLGCAPDAKSLASSIEGITTVVHAGGRDGTEVIFTTIEGHGHIWPGGKSPLPEFIVGKTTSRLSATDAVWEFFQEHPKPNPKP